MNNIQRQRIGYDWSWLIILAMIVSVITAGCATNKRMVMPTGCKPPKKKEYHMIAPAQHNHEKKFMTSKKKKAK